jgi:hypothetical protein
MPTEFSCEVQLKEAKKSMAFIPQANYTDRVAASGQRSKLQLLSIVECRVVSASVPHGR